jgi:hypothetical protein
MDSKGDGLLKIGDFSEFGKFDENSIETRIQELKKLNNYINNCAQLGHQGKFNECL